MHLKTLTPDRQVSESGYRFLDPELGRFVSRDPLDEAGDENAFRFAANNAVNLIDPLGLIFGNPVPPIVISPPGIVLPIVPAPPPAYDLSDSYTGPGLGRWKSFSEDCSCATIKVKGRPDADNRPGRNVPDTESLIANDAPRQVGVSLVYRFKRRYYRLACCDCKRITWKNYAQWADDPWAPDPTAVYSEAQVQALLGEFNTTILADYPGWRSGAFVTAFNLDLRSDAICVHSDGTESVVAEVHTTVFGHRRSIFSGNTWTFGYNLNVECTSEWDWVHSRFVAHFEA